MYYSEFDKQSMKILEDIGRSFKEKIQFLEDNQVEYDIGCENIIRDHGRIKGKKLVVNKCVYDLVVIPDKMSNIDKSTFELLKDYIAAGGTVLQIGEDLELVDGDKNNELIKLADNKNWIIKNTINNQVLEEYLLLDNFKITPSSTGRVHHHRRQLKNGQVIFISNFSLEESADTEIRVEGASVEEICPQGKKTGG